MPTKNDIDLAACVGVDSETCRIRAALPAPPVVCTAFYDPQVGAPALYATADQWRPLLELFSDQRRIVVGHNVGYDTLCWAAWGPAELLPLILEAYQANRVLDTMLAQRLVEIETGDMRGKLALDRLCARYGLHVSKQIVAEDDDGEERNVRTDYGRFLGRPLEEYTEEHRAYALEDPRVTWELFGRILARGLVRRADLGKMARTDFALKYTAAFGLAADPERVDALRATAQERLIELQTFALENGYMRSERNKPNPVRNVHIIKRKVAEVYGIPVRVEGANGKQILADLPDDELQALQARGLLTDGGKTGRVGPATGRLVLEESGDPELAQLAAYGEWAAVWNKDLKVFSWSAEHGLPFHTRFGFAATTRTTSGGSAGEIPGMNIQNFRKKAGIRECIRGRLGALVSSDYTGLENGTLAQVIYDTTGRRGMADKISAGHDFHCEVGGHILRIDYDTMAARLKAGDPDAKQARSAAKPLNFGLPGFMTRAETVQSYARIGYGVNLPVQRWQELIDLWYATQHDQVAYLLEYVDGLKVGEGRGAVYNVPIPGTGIIRRGATRTAAANTGFQGAGAQLAGDALWRVTKAQLLGKMPGRLCAFIHDELITDCKPEDVEAVRAGHEYHMLEAAKAALPNVKMAVESSAMTHWSKDAKTIYDASGALQIDLGK